MKKALLIISICIFAGFLYGEYYIGCKVDSLPSGIHQVTLFSRIVTAGVIVSFVSLIFSFIKKFNKINAVLVVISSVIAVMSIVSIPNWNSIG